MGGAAMVTEADLTFCYSTLEDWVELLLTLQELATRNDYEGFACRFDALSRMPESETHRLRDLFEQTEAYRLAAPTAFPPDLCGSKGACWSDVVAFVALAKLPHVISSAIPALQDEYSRMCAEQEKGRDVEPITDMRMLWSLCRALWGPWPTWNGGPNDPIFIGLTEESFGPVRDQVSQVFSLIRQQRAPAVLALRREHRHVLLEMRRGGIVRSDSTPGNEPPGLANPLTPPSAISSFTADNRPEPTPPDPNNRALWSRARLIKLWLPIIAELTGREKMSHDTFTKRMRDGIYPAHPIREGHQVRLLLSSLPPGYDDSN